VRVEIVAVGSELLLGQSVDTNSTVIAAHLAEAGIDCQFQVRVGDNVERIAMALRAALARADAVVVCGGLGPTQDDVTREAIAAVMGVELREDRDAAALVRAAFARRGRAMAASNLRQALVPVGASIIPQRLGTAPGLVCPVGDRVVYALPGVPRELEEMLERAVLPDLRRRAGSAAVILSRTLRTAGLAESVLAEILEPRFRALEASGPGAVTIAFLASGVEGIKVRLTVKAPNQVEAARALDAEEEEVRRLLGDAVFGVDDETMEAAVGKLLREGGRMLALAESFTGGLMASRVVALAGASEWFAGGVVTYASEAKRRVLEIEVDGVVSGRTAAAMAEAVRSLFGADVGLATTGVAGPDRLEGRLPGTAFVGIALDGEPAEALELSLPGDREQVRGLGTLSAFDALRRRLLTRARRTA